MAQQKVETAAERWDFCREKPGRWIVGGEVASIRSSESESAPLPMHLGPSPERSDGSWGEERSD